MRSTVALGSTGVDRSSAMADALVGADPSVGAAGSVPRRYRPLGGAARVPRLRARVTVPGVVAELLGSDQVWLYEDSVLVKEPGTVERTHFHQDLAYFHLDGDQVCTVWVPLDAVDAENGAVRYVRGSHLDRTPRRPNLFVTTDTLPGTEGEAVTDASGDPALIGFDTQPGDIVVHDARTIHGAHANRSTTRRRRARSRCGTRVTTRSSASSPARRRSRTTRCSSRVRGWPIRPARRLAASGGLVAAELGGAPVMGGRSSTFTGPALASHTAGMAFTMRLAAVALPPPAAPGSPGSVPWMVTSRFGVAGHPDAVDAAGLRSTWASPARSRRRCG